MAKLTESDIRQVANIGSFEKGYSYYHDGYVLSVVQRGEQLTLQDGRVISADCSCPYDWGGYCKHIVAALLYYVHETADIETKPEVDEMLANLTEAQLRQLLIVLAQEQPGVVEVIEREIGWLKQTPIPGTEPGTADPIAADIVAIRRQLRKDFRSSGPSSRYDDYYYDDYYDEYFDPSAYLPLP